MCSIFERFCYNDVKEPCKSFYNCTPCPLSLADPSCNRIQYNLEELTIKTEAEINNCTKVKEHCEDEFADCLEPFVNCINNCTAYLRKDTLTRYEGYEGIILSTFTNKITRTCLERIAHLMSYQENSNWTQDYWHTKYGSTLDDMERIQLFLYFIGTNFWLAFFSLTLSFLSATYGITKVNLQDQFLQVSNYQ